MRYFSSTSEAKTLAAALTSSATSMQLNSVTTLPVNYPYTLVIDPDTAKEEIVLVTGYAGGLLTITRGTSTYGGIAGGNGTSAQAHDNGAVVKHMVTARDLQEPQDHIAATSGIHGVTGDLVGTDSTQTLTNKTISGTSNTITVSQSQVTGLSTSLGLKADLASPTFTGSPVLPTGTTGVTQTAGNATTALATTAFTGTAVSNHASTTTGVHGVTGSVVGTSDTQTLTNKTLTAPVIATISNSGTLTLPTGTDNIVSRTSTDTLTNKTLTAPTIGGAVTISAGATVSVGGVSLSTSELSYLDTVSSNIQTQIDGKETKVIGEVKAYLGVTTPPTDWLFCDGTTFDGSVYTALRDLLLDRYGVHSGNNYYLPNFKNRFLRGAASTTSLSGTVAGSDTHSHGGVTGAPSATVSNLGTGGTTGPTSTHTHTIASDNNIPAYFEVNWIIRAK